MIRKILYLATAAMMLILSGTCQATDKYEEANEVYEQYIPALEKYLAAVDTSENPKSLAIAINAFADSVEVLAPKMKNLAEKYPDMAKEPSIPADYAEIAKKSEGLGQKFAQSFARIAPFMDDPEVEKANERLAEAMGAMADE